MFRNDPRASIKRQVSPQPLYADKHALLEADQQNPFIGLLGQYTLTDLSNIVLRS
jgi:hypothetical protein